MTDKNFKENDVEKEFAGKSEHLPPIEFSSLVLPFFTNALIKLGNAENPENESSEKDLQEVKRMIDLLELLKDRTKGNLKSDEEKFLNAGLHQLRMAYLEKSKTI